MEPSFIVPVETVLEVGEKELLIRDNQIVSTNSSSLINKHLIGTQCNDWKTESPQSKSCNLSLVNTTRDNNVIEVKTEDKMVENKNSKEMSFAVTEWRLNKNDSNTSNTKQVPSTIEQPTSFNFQELLTDDNFLLQFDYKTRNKLKTKQRRLDPFYRCQERDRQRTVMRIKRQNPDFRAVEREKGRYRMQIKRLDPEFRSQERERQRERMKIKRSDPDFREKERELQKLRLQEKRLDPAFKEKEREQDRLRMCIKRQSNGLHSIRYSDKSSSLVSNSLSKIYNIKKQFGNDLADLHCKNSLQMRNTQAAFPENIDTGTLLPKSCKKEPEAFNFKKQRILNFNSPNEQLTSNAQLSSQAITLDGVGDQNDKFKPPLKNELISSLHNDKVATMSIQICKKC